MKPVNCLCQHVTNSFRGEFAQVSETWESLGAGLKVEKDLMRATTSSLGLAQLDKVTDHHKHYVNSLRDQLLEGGIACPLKICNIKRNWRHWKPSEPPPARRVGLPR